MSTTNTEESTLVDYIKKCNTVSPLNASTKSYIAVEDLGSFRSNSTFHVPQNHEEEMKATNCKEEALIVITYRWEILWQLKYSRTP